MPDYFNPRSPDFDRRRYERKILAALRDQFMDFTKWLPLQAERNDPVGDVARDYVADDCVQAVTQCGIHRHMATHHDADEAALEALDRAWDEYCQVADRWELRRKHQRHQQREKFCVVS
jgi:hypothetical protein